MGRAVEVLNQEEHLQIEPESISNCILALDSYPGFHVPQGSIEVACVDLVNCCQLHDTFFGDPEPTDVMTFPGDPEDDHAGDIAICPAIAAEAARDSGLPFREELTLYLVHAWLHLAGLADHDTATRLRMREAEASLMDHLKSADCLLSCQWIS